MISVWNLEQEVYVGQRVSNNIQADEGKTSLGEWPRVEERTWESPTQSW